MNDVAASFASLGTVRTISANRPIDLLTADSAFLVTGGALDLFALDATGARHHLGRFSVGSLVLGRALQRQPRLIGLGLPGTTLVEIAHAELLEAVDAEAAARLLDGFIEGMEEALTDRLPEKRFVALSADATTKLKKGQAARPRTGVVWVDGRPLTPISHFEVSAATKLSPVGTKRVLEDGLGPLLDYLTASLDRIEAGVRRKQTRYQTRREERLAADETALTQALVQLGTFDQTPRTEEASSDPLMVACQAIGRDLGVRVRPPPRDTVGATSARARLQAIARASGIRTRPVLLKGNWHREDNGPLLAFRSERPVALLSARPGRYRLLDGEQVETVDEAVASDIDGVAFQFYRPLPARPIKPLDLIRFALRGTRRDLLQVLGIGMLMGLLGLIMPLATGQIFDRVIPGAERGLLVQLVLAMLAIALGQTAFAVAKAVAEIRIEARMSASTQAAVWDRLLELPLPFFRRFSSGDLAVRATGIDQIREIISGTTLSAILAGLFSVWNFGLLFYFDATLAVAATLLMVAAGVVAVVGALIEVRLQRRIADAGGRLSSLLFQLVEGISKLRTSGTETRAFGVWAALFSQKREQDYRSGAINNGFDVFQSLFPLVATIVIFWLAATRTELSTGAFLAFNAAFSAFLAASLGVIDAGIGALSIVPLYERARPILDQIPEVDEQKGDPGELRGEIEVNRVTFRYADDRPLVLREVSLRVGSGEMVAVVGASGSGKSTLFRLLLGFERPTSGGVYYDGQALASLDVRAVRSQLGVVLQNGQIIGGDIYENIAGATGISVEEAWDAAKQAGFDKDIRAMPMGIHTVIPQGGGTLSGGQRQRMLIARALATKPRIILFDEATSALDNRTQAIVSESLERLQATRVVIAHRLSTIQNADRIVVLERGAVAETGTFDELLANDGPFARLARRQML